MSSWYCLSRSWSLFDSGLAGFARTGVGGFGGELGTIRAAFLTACGNESTCLIKLSKPPNPKFILLFCFGFDQSAAKQFFFTKLGLSSLSSVAFNVGEPRFFLQ